MLYISHPSANTYKFHRPYCYYFMRIYWCHIHIFLMDIHIYILLVFLYTVKVIAVVVGINCIFLVWFILLLKCRWFIIFYHAVGCIKPLSCLNLILWAQWSSLLVKPFPGFIISVGDWVFVVAGDLLSELPSSNEWIFSNSFSRFWCGVSMTFWTSNIFSDWDF